MLRAKPGFSFSPKINQGICYFMSILKCFTLPLPPQLNPVMSEWDGEIAREEEGIGFLSRSVP